MQLLDGVGELLYLILIFEGTFSLKCLYQIFTHTHTHTHTHTRARARAQTNLVGLSIVLEQIAQLGLVCELATELLFGSNLWTEKIVRKEK